MLQRNNMHICTDQMKKELSNFQNLTVIELIIKENNWYWDLIEICQIKEKEKQSNNENVFLIAI